MAPGSASANSASSNHVGTLRTLRTPRTTKAQKGRKRQQGQDDLGQRLKRGSWVVVRSIQLGDGLWAEVREPEVGFPPGCLAFQRVHRRSGDVRCVVLDVLGQRRQPVGQRRGLRRQGRMGR